MELIKNVVRNGPRNDSVGRRIMNIAALCLLGTLMSIVSLNHHQRGWLFRVTNEHNHKEDTPLTRRSLQASNVNFYNVQNIAQGAKVAKEQSVQKNVQPNVQNKPKVAKEQSVQKNNKTNDIGDRTRIKGVAWLMGFPNSGTMFTTDLTATASQAATGTNYGNELLKSLGRDFIYDPEYAISDQGPYKSSKFPMPEGYLLTKTHCTGYCMECPPEKYMTPIEKFMDTCRSGVRPKTLNELELKTDPRPNKGTLYDAALVEKAVLLFRNPFDNVVANFRYAFGKHHKAGDTDWTYSKDVTGFREWCQDMDMEYQREEGSWYSPLVAAASRNVPCHGQFYQYIHWHENAVETTKRLGISRLDIFYEDYHLNYDETLKTILEHLELPRRGKNPMAFRWKKGYSEFYTRDEMVNIQRFIRFIASDQVYELLGRYFDPANEQSNKAESRNN